MLDAKTNWLRKKDECFKNIITNIRSVRSRMNVSPAKYSDLVIQCKKEEQIFISDYSSLLKALARIENISMGIDIEKPKQSATIISDGMELYSIPT